MISERVEMEIIAFIGIALLIGLYLGQQTISVGALGILGGYVGNQAINKTGTQQVEQKEPIVEGEEGA